MPPPCQGVLRGFSTLLCDCLPTQVKKCMVLYSIFFSWAYTYCAAILMNFLKSCTRLQSVGHSSTSVITHCWDSLQRCNSCSSATVWPALASRLRVKYTSSCCRERKNDMAVEYFRRFFFESSPKDVNYIFSPLHYSKHFHSSLKHKLRYF